MTGLARVQLYLLGVMLKVEHKEKTESRRFEVLRDEATGRSFHLVFFIQGAEKGGEDISVMVSGLAGHFHVSELRPNGRLIAKDNNGILDVPEAEWDEVRGIPSRAYATICAFKSAHPGYDFVLTGGGRGCRSIYYPKRAEALRVIENALLADVWVMDSEPIRHRKLGRRAQISLEDYAELAKAPGQERIMQALGRVEKLLKKNQTLEVATHLENFRIEVRQAELEYPENMRLMVSFTGEGRPVADSSFARQGFYKIADALMRKRVSRYDQAEGVSRGIPGYGQDFDQSARPPIGWRLEDCLGYQDDSSDKIYAHVRAPDGQSYVAWGRREGPSLQVKPMGTYEAQKVVRSKLSHYSPIDVSSIPNFWDRVTQAIARK